MSSGLRFDGVSKTFRSVNGDVTALASFDLSVEPGQFVVVVGPSGCGKSTMLHIAAGLDTHYDGVFEAAGGKPASAYLFQSPRLLPWLSAEENIAFVLRPRGFGGAGDGSRPAGPCAGKGGCDRRQERWRAAVRRGADPERA